MIGFMGYCTAAPGTPSNFTASVLNSTAIFVSWRSPVITNGIILRYDLFYTNTSVDCTNGLFMSITAVLDLIEYNTTLTGLGPYMAYTLCVKAQTAAGFGNFSLVTAKTYPEISTPPTNLSVTTLNSTSGSHRGLSNSTQYLTDGKCREHHHFS